VQHLNLLVGRHAAQCILHSLLQRRLRVKIDLRLCRHRNHHQRSDYKKSFHAKNSYWLYLRAKILLFLHFHSLFSIIFANSVKKSTFAADSKRGKPQSKLPQSIKKEGRTDGI
jgi:hypothetical protein